MAGAAALRGGQFREKRRSRELELKRAGSASFLQQSRNVCAKFRLETRRFAETMQVGDVVALKLEKE